MGRWNSTSICAEGQSKSRASSLRSKGQEDYSTAIAVAAVTGGGPDLLCMMRSRELPENSTFTAMLSAGEYRPCPPGDVDDGDGDGEEDEEGVPRQEEAEGEEGEVEVEGEGEVEGPPGKRGNRTSRFCVLPTERVHRKYIAAFIDKKNSNGIDVHMHSRFDKAAQTGFKQPDLFDSLPGRACSSRRTGRP